MSDNLEFTSAMSMEQALNIWRHLNSREFKLLLFIYAYFHNPDAIVRQLSELEWKERFKKLQQLAVKELEYYEHDSS